MGTLIAFILGLIVGGCFGMVCTAIISIDRRDDDE